MSDGTLPPIGSRWTFQDSHLYIEIYRIEYDHTIKVHTFTLDDGRYTGTYILNQEEFYKNAIAIPN